MLDIKSLATVNGEFYEVEPGDVYPATAEWLADNADTLRDLLAQSDPALVERALTGDDLARFVLRARQTLGKALHVIDTTPDWQDLIGLSIWDIIQDADTRPRRHDVLETLRALFTEVLHQQVGGNGQRLNLRILKNEAYRL